MERRKHTITSTGIKYNKIVPKLGDNKSLLRQLNLLGIIDDFIDMADWYGINESAVDDMRKKSLEIMTSDHRIYMLTDVNEEYNRNVNTPQNIDTWRKIKGGYFVVTGLVMYANQVPNVPVYLYSVDNMNIPYREGRTGTGSVIGRFAFENVKRGDYIVYVSYSTRMQHIPITVDKDVYVFVNLNFPNT